MIPRGVFLTAVLVVGGIAAAVGAIPGNDGSISGCYVKTTGALRVTDAEASTPPKCRSTEIALAWNQQGVQGETGQTGPAGPAGEQGPAGTSGAEVYFEGRSSATVDSPTTLVNMAVPAGRYLAQARFTAGVESSSSGARYVTCDLSEGGGAFDTAKARLSSADPYLQYEMTAVIDHPDANTPVKILCDAPFGAVSVPSATLLMTKVASVN